MQVNQRVFGYGAIASVLVGLAMYAVLLMPNTAQAYSYAYGQGYYYTQGHHYAYTQGYYYAYAQSYYQASYLIKFTKNAAEAVNLTVSGSISKGAGSFVIDDPLDPKNKLLYHSFAESQEAKNIYDGIARLDGKGEATVRLPTYFDSLNTGVRYQLKPIGAPMPNLYVKEEERSNKFTIGGGVPNGKVSWQVTGIRKDAYILANPIVTEVDKGPGQLVEKGQYLFPAGFHRLGFVPIEENGFSLYEDVFSGTDDMFRF